MNSHYLRILLTFVLTTVCVARAISEPFEFALIGDLPYGVKIGEKDHASEKLFKHLNQQPLSWVIHVGDIKTGGSTCSDEMLLDRKARFDTIQHPFVFTPGDNEWTDCHRALAGSFDPLERLNKLREIFYSEEELIDLKKTLKLTSQSEAQDNFADFKENFHWQKDGVHFATLHIVGSSNGKQKFSQLSKVKHGKAHKKEVKQRENAATAWLTQVFTEAKSQQAKALFVAIHANTGLGKRDKDKHDPFAFFNRRLEKELKDFDKPLVLAHGDSHYFRLDKPSVNGWARAPKNFMRLESFGENNSAWVKVSVDPESPQVFSYSIYDLN